MESVLHVTLLVFIMLCVVYAVSIALVKIVERWSLGFMTEVVVLFLGAFSIAYIMVKFGILEII